MAQKPSTPKGTRDFLPAEVAKRNYIFDTIRSSFETYGFSPIETPSFELSSTLLGKYGEEGDRLIFKILNSGDKVRKADLEALKDGNLARFSNSLAEKALRYDLTVPFARFVVQHQNELAFPFKRYQIQPVWRADRPQKGRYQEFYQCDVDVVGSDSLLYEVDFVLLFDEVLSNLKIPNFTVKINNRKILSGIAEVCGEEDKIIAITVAIDKLDKIGVEGVVKELRVKEISESALERIMPLFEITGSTKERLAQMKSYLESSEIGLKGIEELEFVLDQANELGVNSDNIEFDVTLARGLNYYTGAIFEVIANDVNIGSICGGGRYDDLTGVFGMPGVSGVGVSFGADRIYDVLEELDLFPSTVDNRLDVLFVNFGEMEQAHCLKAVRTLRAAGISSEVYPTPAKMQKQMKYANARGVKNVAMLGANEIEEGIIKLKNMDSGEQTSVNVQDLINTLK
ncbi:MAG: histidine--tRNA ligase [Crocinitomicaceae bacterium]|nr:histidine--tRNA ligase [Flavobacteriales bacterium]NQZ34323.1 histidine--tRNA ligase [Crocinitomicaceae bacterium]